MATLRGPSDTPKRSREFARRRLDVGPPCDSEAATNTDEKGDEIPNVSGATSNEIDSATTDLCKTSAIRTRWSYVLETDSDDFNFVSTGQVLLRDDGRVFQRVYLSGSRQFGPWHEASKGPGDGPYTADEVERLFNRWDSNYFIRRLREPDDVPGHREKEGLN